MCEVKNKLLKRIIDHGKYQYPSKRQRKIAWDLTRRQVEKLFQNDLCSRTGISFKYQPNNPLSPSLDRIDPNVDRYSIDNVQAVVKIYNLAKHDGTDDDVLSFAFQFYENKSLAYYLFCCTNRECLI
jgi:hypothetical protein